MWRPVVSVLGVSWVLGTALALRPVIGYPGVVGLVAALAVAGGAAAVAAGGRRR